MSELEMPWEELLADSTGRDLLAKKLYVVFSEPTDGMAPVTAILGPHVEHQVRLEREGVMFAAGPLATEDERFWRGEGMFMYRAGSMAEARRHAEADPMHSSGARSFRIRPWLLNEGCLTIGVRYSTGRAEVI
jgi:uncharacterized protein YciI